ncbi:hypothetical protein [Mesorhizobium koreense]|jgi:hypothetical protein|nr:hypothetical protein [Mesorhizobium sp. WR6]
MRDSIAPIGAAVNAFFRALRQDECFPRDKHKTTPATIGVLLVTAVTM